jgi:GNAT superfamily N-acetyltransferase
MTFREAVIKDISEIQIVRNLVHENRLSDPAKVTNQDVEEYITRRGKGWVCEIDKIIAGFAIADIEGHNVWALFVRPEFEKKGIGKKLHNLMMNWYFSQTNETIWLSTSPGTRAEIFYRKMGWQQAGVHGIGEIKFEFSARNWKK